MRQTITLIHPLVPRRLKTQQMTQRRARVDAATSPGLAIAR